METNQTQQTEPIELKEKNSSGLTEQNLGVIAHVSALAAIFFPVIGAIAGPLAVYLLSTDKPEAQKHAKAALNFNISFSIYFIVAALLGFILIGFLLMPILAIFWLVLIVMGAIQASEGKLFKYPATIEFIK